MFAYTDFILFLSSFLERRDIGYKLPHRMFYFSLLLKTAARFQLDILKNEDTLYTVSCEIKHDSKSHQARRRKVEDL